MSTEPKKSRISNIIKKTVEGCGKGIGFVVGAGTVGAVGGAVVGATTVVKAAGQAAVHSATDAITSRKKDVKHASEQLQVVENNMISLAAELKLKQIALDQWHEHNDPDLCDIETLVHGKCRLDARDQVQEKLQSLQKKQERLQAIVSTTREQLKGY